MQLSDHPYFIDENITYAQVLFKEALKELGLTRDVLPPIIFTFGISPRNKKIAELLQRQWEEGLGVTIILEGCEYGYYREKVRLGKFQIGNGEWIGDFNDPITFLELFKTKDPALNPSGWEDEDYIHLLDLSNTTIDQEERKRLLKEAEEILMKGMPISPLYYYSFDYVKPAHVQDVILLPTGIPDYKRAKIQY